MRPFRYEQLGLPDSEIRLLDLLPGQGRVRCRLRKMALETARGQYEPLSYCWGDQKQQVTMIVDDGRALSIGLSLDAALRRLRFEQNRVRTLWVDAVCINQNDLPEKNIQVQLMTRIYQNGCRTLIWLGEHDVHTAEVFRMLETLAGYFRRNPDMDMVWIRDWNAIYREIQPRKRKYGIVGRVFPERALTTPQYMRLLSRLESVFGRPWFRRVWIIQEIATSSEAQVICGAYQIDWETIETVRSFTSDELTSRGYLTMLIEQRKDFQSSADSPLEGNLLTGTKSEAGNPRDRVYAMLGLTTPVSRERHLNWPLSIDYGAGVNKVFTDATKHCIEVSGTLGILAGSAGCRGYESPGLPSWVLCPAQADDNIHPEIMWNAIDQTPHYHGDDWTASKSSKCAAIFGNGGGNDNLLRLKGIVLDRIAVAGPVRETIPRHPLKMRDYPKAVRHFLKAIRCYFRWRAVAGVDAKPAATGSGDDHTDGTGGSTREAFERTMCAVADNSQMELTLDEIQEQFREFEKFMAKEFSFLQDKRASATSCHRGRIRDDVRVLVQCVKCVLEIALSRREDVAMANHAESQLASWWENKRLVRTEGDRIGMASRNAQEGDSVVLLQGSHTPYVLRFNGSQWTVVSECYIHGIMHGEAWDESSCNTLWIK